MSDLWQPSSEEASDIARGDRKERKYHAIQAGAFEIACPYCSRDVWYSPADDRYFTEGWSQHKCKGMSSDL